MLSGQRPRQLPRLGDYVYLLTARAEYARAMVVGVSEKSLNVTYPRWRYKDNGAPDKLLWHDDVVPWKEVWRLRHFRSGI